MKVEGTSPQFTKPRGAIDTATSGMDKINDSKKELNEKLSKAQNPGIIKKIFTSKAKREKEVMGLENAQKNVDLMMDVLRDFMKRYYGG
ncbi:MAG TPA: hypothetical protein DD435_06695 [Cyanobacteria bacterium UBA8530]|nr:hypothetical protein [Cyanobacteria bacterium UBA8530]